ncbi:putative E3 ubiquitin-protein ligase LIN-2 [Diospyros lotus]|uniref:putative E3 ubiquitin-protein ligase LIN-2 n=1 Tax=Diospyros lotus TaxID=55363 RepID=UPI0022504A43|nr:putative E3 ubiquitin-protein ligase LIN-2 [Diospyros lotus]
MASLQELLAQEGFERGKFHRRRLRFRDRTREDESTALPIYICHGRNGHGNSKDPPAQIVSQRRGSSDSGRSRLSNSMSIAGEPAMDEVAVRAVVSILSGYIGQYLRDERFRESIREKCFSCFTRRNESSDNGIFANMELGVESIDKLVENPGTKSELKLKLLRNSIRLLNIVASLNSEGSRNGSTCGTLNSHLSACAQLYLAIVYKLEKNDRISARHLLRVFCDSPFLARTHLLPELWEHFFLPHLLHLKVWYSEELEFLSNSDYVGKEKKMKALCKVYNDQIDAGTTQFALYYKEWLKVGAQPPPVPSIPLPSRPSHASSRRRSLEYPLTSHSSVDKSLYRVVLGSTLLERRSMDFDDRSRALVNTWDLEEGEKAYYVHEDNVRQPGSAEHRTMAHRSSSSRNYTNPKSDYFCLLGCRSEPAERSVQGNQIGSRDSIRRSQNIHPPPNDFSRAIIAICSPDSISECEVAIRVITKTWLDLQADPTIEEALSKAPVIEGMLDVLHSSTDDEILELTISLIAELVTRNDANRHIILNSDPQLTIFMALFRSNSLFLKAAILLFLVKPKAKQMISIEWVPLVLQVLEFGDQLQTLLAVRCSPQVAAYYFLDQLLTGFDEDKNLENARLLVSIGGLRLLVKRMEIGDANEKAKAASIILCCIQAEGSCRHYLAKNLKKSSLIELLVPRRQTDSQWLAVALLTELLCLNRRTEVTRFLEGLLSERESLNTLHILFAYLQKARIQEQPVVAAILLQLDLLGDPMNCSVYRHEVVEAITVALGCWTCNEEVQEQSARALSLLGGCFSYTGQPTTEKWLLKEAGFSDNSGDFFQGKNIVVAGLIDLNEEDDATHDWQRKAASVLLTCGKKTFLAAFSNSISNGIPCLARASLVTVAWVTRYLDSIGDDDLQLAACTVLLPCLIESLNDDNALEGRVLASFTLHTLLKSSADCFSIISSVDDVLTSRLRDLSRVTWTAKELISAIRSSSRHRILS